MTEIRLPERLNERRACGLLDSLIAVFKTIIAFLTFTCLPARTITLHNLKSVAVIGGTLVPRLESFIVAKAAKLGCVMSHAVTPLLNIWHTRRSDQNVSQPASFNWSDILLPTPRTSPQWAPTISSSPSYLHGGFPSLMGGLGATHLRCVKDVSRWNFKSWGVCPSSAWWTWFLWYSGNCRCLIMGGWLL